MTDQIERIRTGLVAEVREGGQSLPRVIADAANSQADRLSTALADARNEQGEQLDRLRDAQAQATGGLQRAVADSTALARKELKESIDQQGRVTEGLKESLAGSSRELREAVTAALETARGHQTEQLERLREGHVQAAQRLERAVGEAMTTGRSELRQSLEAQTTSLSELRREVSSGIVAMSEAQVKQLRDVGNSVAGQLQSMRKENEQKLESMRATVEEKLQTTLEGRLGESFRQVSDRLEKVHQGLGEMKSLATGVGDLKKVLTNVRSRGVFGEGQLAALLEEAFSPEQFERNVETRPLSNQRVEFAIKLPGRDDEASPVWLPIDAKFPLEDYQRLEEAYEDGDTKQAETARASLRQRVLVEAETIKTKYVAPPHTTYYALMFLPTEGLYAEILRIPGLLDEMQRTHHVVPVGPTTLHALIASLQMEFKTLAIGKQSSEVWRVLGAVKTEFASFGESLQAVDKKLKQAGTKIEDVARRSRALQRKLRGVEQLSPTETRAVLGPAPAPAPAAAAEAELQTIDAK